MKSKYMRTTLASTDQDIKDYGALLYYDQFFPPTRVSKRVYIGHTVTGSSSSLDAYIEGLINLFGLKESPPLPITQVDWVIKRPTDEELWLSLVGIFASGDRRFAEQHDQIYGQTR